MTKIYDINKWEPEGPWILNQYGEKILKVNDDGSLRVKEVVRTFQTFDTTLTRATGQTTLATATAVDDRTIELVSATGLVVDDVIGIATPTVDPLKLYSGRVLAINANTVTVDLPLDFAFPVDSIVVFLKDHLNVDGSITPIVFSIAPLIGPPYLGFTINVTRMMFQMTTDSAPEFTDFGDITGGLDIGVAIRKRSLLDPFDTRNITVGLRKKQRLCRNCL